MKATLTLCHFRLLLVVLSFLIGGRAGAAPVLDGQITAGEYGTAQNQLINGQTWYMTWDANNLYVAVSGKMDLPAVVFFDTNPATSNGTATGIKYPFTVTSNPGDVTILPPFRADYAVFFGNSTAQPFSAATNGSWAAAGSFAANAPGSSGNIIQLAVTTSGQNAIRELRIDRNTLGLGQSQSFNWLGYVVYDPNNASQTGFGCVPTSNPSGYQSTTADVRAAPYYFTVPDMNTATPFGLTSINFPASASGTVDMGSMTVYDFILNNPNLTIRNAGTWTINGRLAVQQGILDMNSSNSNVIIGQDLVVSPGAELRHSTGNSNITINGNLQLDGSFVPNNGRLTLAGNQAQTVSAGTYYDLFIPGTGTKTLQGTIRVVGTLNLSGGVLETGPYRVVLAPNSTDPGNIALRETGNGYVRGTVEASGNVTGPNNYLFSGIGLTLTPSVNSVAVLGPTTVTRYTGGFVTGKAYGPNFTALSQSILRQYKVEATQTTNLNYKLIFAYRDANPNELTYTNPSGTVYSNDETNLELFRTADPVNGTWQDLYFSTRDAVANNLVVTGLSNLTQGNFFTLADRARPLPVTLTTFTATAAPAGTQLVWRTAAETNQPVFVLERTATPEGNWETIGQVTGRGTTEAGATYTYQDATARPGRWFYRLRVQETGAADAFSTVVTVQLTGSPALRAYPMPAGEETVLSGLETGQRIEVVDALGRCVRQQTADQASTTLRLSGLAPGWYLVRALGTTPQQLRLLKQ